MLVVLVVYLFLQSIRTTLICMVAIVVSLIATFAGMLALGFSINLHHAVRPRARDRHRRRRCDRRRRERRAQHARAPPRAQGGHDQVDGRDRELAGRRRAGDVRRCSSRRRSCPARPASSTSSSPSRSSVSVAVSGFVALTLTPGDVRADAEAQSAAAARILRVVQPPGRRADPRLRPRGRVRDQARTLSRWCCSSCSSIRSITSSRYCRRASCRTRTRAT